MAKVGLDAICAKLSHNAEMTSSMVNRGLPSHRDDVDEDGKTFVVDSVSEQRRATLSGSAALPTAVTESVNVVEQKNETFPVTAVDGASLLTDSVREAALNDDNMDVVGACRRSRRKNFLPRCVQDGLVVVERPHQTADDTTSTTTVEDVEEGQPVLDLRTTRTVSRSSSDRPVTMRSANDDTQLDQVLDLSVSRYGRGPVGDDVFRDSVMAGAGGLNVADMRLYAANTVAELLHIYGLPDDSQSATADLRKWDSADENSSCVGTSTVTAANVRNNQFDVTGSTSRIQERKQALTSTSTGVVDGKTTELSRLAGACTGVTVTI